MVLGKQIRLNRLFSHSSGRLVSVAIDHAISYCYELPPRLGGVREVLSRVVRARPDAVTLHKGVARECFPPHAGEIPLIVQATAHSPHHPADDYPIASVSEAIRLGADAIAVGISGIAGTTQKSVLSLLATIVREADAVGLPVVGHIYPLGDAAPPDEQHSPKYVEYAARAGAEVGVDVVKTFYTGSVETFRRVVESCPIKVVAAGGPKTPTTRALLEMAANVVEAGGAGMTCGRNVWQASDIEGTVQALKAIIHEGRTVEEAAASASLSLA